MDHPFNQKGGHQKRGKKGVNKKGVKSSFDSLVIILGKNQFYLELFFS
jgi:hypothetical protein